MTKTTPIPQLPSAASQDHFIHPDNLELSGQLARHADVDFRQEALPSDLWTARELEIIQTQLQTWLKTKDMHHLEILLRQVPTSIAHPVVFRQLAYLRELQHHLDVTDIKAFNEEDPDCLLTPLDFDDPVLPAGAKSTALKVLVRLTSSWVGPWIPILRTLGQPSEYTLQPPPRPRKRRGRPRKYFDHQLLDSLNGYNKYRAQLQKLGKSYFQFKRGEKRPAFLARIAKAVQKVDLPEFEFHALKFYPPPPVDALRIVRNSLGKSKRKVLLNRLIFHLLAYHMKCTPDQIRGFVERAEQVFTEHHLRGPSADRW
jgi:hypothetical protein